MKRFIIYYLFFYLFLFCLDIQAQWSIPFENERNNEAFSNKAYDIMVKGNERELSSFFHKNKILIKYRSANWFVIHIYGTQIEKLLKSTFIEEVFWSSDKGVLLNDRVIGNANVAGLQEIGIYDEVLNGSDVIIGFIDAGLDYSHPDFINEDGSSRILYFWDQKNPVDSAEIFEEYGYGKLITQDTLNQWISNDTQIILDPNSWYGHGSTVVGTACSNGNALQDLIEEGTMEVDFHGIAPLSSIMMVASDFDHPNWLMSVADGVHFMLTKAEELNKPIVINLSIGTYSGSHDGLDPVGVMINDWFSDEYPGRSLVCAGGNSRTLRYHLGYASTSDTSYSMFTSFNGPTELGRMSYFEAWLDSIDISSFESSIGLFDHSASQEIQTNNLFRDIEENIGVIIVDSIYDLSSNLIAICRRYMQYQGEQIQFQVQVDHMTSNNLSSILFTKGNAHLDCWSADWLSSSNIIGEESLPGSFLNEHFQNPDSLMQIVSSFSCAENAITVSNFKNRLSYIDVNNNLQSFEGQLGELAMHSSRGPTRDGRIKPELAASGELILSSGPFNYREILLSSAPQKLAQGGWHMRNGGSSMASPIVAGIAALYLQRCPLSLPSQIKQALLSTAYQDIYTGILPNTSWGSGKVDGLATLQVSQIPIIIEESVADCNEGILNLSLQGSYSSIEWNTGDSLESICVGEGEYWLSAIDENGCKQISNVINVIGSGIKEESSLGLFVFPNPSFGKFMLRGLDSDSDFEIVNLLGQKQLFEKRIVSNSEFQINLKECKNGVYYLIEKKSGKSIELYINK